MKSISNRRNIVQHKKLTRNRFADAGLIARGILRLVIIKSPDTYAFDLAAYYFPKIANIVNM